MGRGGERERGSRPTAERRRRVPAVSSKLGFPLKTRAQNDEVAAGIALHMVGKPAHDALTQIVVPVLPFDDAEVF